MKVLITGATGFIGRNLISALLDQGYDLVAVSRDTISAGEKLPASVQIINWDNNTLRATLETVDVVINLAGAPISSHPWNKKRKTAITNSRLLAAQRLKQALGTIKNKPALFLQASAIGFYGAREGEDCSEMCKHGKGFLADVCARWESYVPEFESLADRVITLRIGVVLGKDGGMVPELLKQSKRHMAGVLGSGEQWISWIHIYDLIYGMIYLIINEKAKGIFNMVAPKAIRQKEFVSLLKNASGAGFQLSAPAFMIRLLLGEFGKELLLSGQKVSAAKMIRQGFMFKYPEAKQALDDIFKPYEIK